LAEALGRSGETRRIQAPAGQVTRGDFQDVVTVVPCVTSRAEPGVDRGLAQVRLWRLPRARLLRRLAVTRSVLGRAARFGGGAPALPPTPNRPVGVAPDRTDARSLVWSHRGRGSLRNPLCGQLKHALEADSKLGVIEIERGRPRSRFVARQD
jgi:hypothetical protein